MGSSSASTAAVAMESISKSPSGPKCRGLVCLRRDMTFFYPREDNPAESCGWKRASEAVAAALSRGAALL